MNSLTINKETLGYQGGFLALVTAVATALLLGVNWLSVDTITLRQREDQLAGLNQVLPTRMYQNDILQSLHAITENQKNYLVFIGKDLTEAVTGYAIQGTTTGYAGDITFLVGLDANANILGVRILAHAETPGLGDKIEIAKSNWVENFKQRSLKNTVATQWAVKKDGGMFDQFTGATITPRAVVKGVHEALINVPLEKVLMLATVEASDKLTSEPQHAGAKHE